MVIECLSSQISTDWLTAGKCLLEIYIKTGTTNFTSIAHRVPDKLELSSASYSQSRPQTVQKFDVLSLTWIHAADHELPPALQTNRIDPSGSHVVYQA